MPNAIANREDVRYVAEATWGTTPATPALKALRMTGESLNAGVQTEVSQEILPDRNISNLIQVGAEAGGGVDFELSYTSFDDMLEALLQGTWTVVTGDEFSLVNASTEKSFTIQKRLADVTQFFIFTGARVNTMSLQVEPGKIVTGSFGFMAKQGTRAGTGIAGATYPAVGTTAPMNGAAGVTLNQVDAAAIPGGLMNFSMDVTNNMRAQKAVGSISAQAIVSGKFETSGNFETYFADGTLYDKFIAMTAFAIKIEITETGVNQKLVFDIPNAKFESSEVVATGTDTDVMMKATYRALYHAATLGALKITRNGPA